MVRMTLRRFASPSASVMIACLVCLVAGCGSGEPGLVKVKGKITLNGGPWPREGLINFAPVGGDASKSRPGSAKFAPDGTFAAGSFEPGDGLFPGEYNLSVDCAEAAPSMSPTGVAIEAKNAAPKQYRDPSTSGLKITVTSAGSSDVSLDVKSK